jgi:hypothetical protein
VNSAALDHGKGYLQLKDAVKITVQDIVESHKETIHERLII